MSATHAARARRVPTKSVQPKKTQVPNGFLPWASLAARLVAAAVFAIAGASKIAEPQATVRAVRAYQLVPEGAVHAVAYGLPAFELSLAALLLLGVAARLVGGIAVAALAIFVAAIASAGLRGLRIDCGCFGGGGTVVHTHYLIEIARDCLLLLVILLIPLSKRTRFAIGNLQGATGRALASATLVVAALVGIAANSAHPSTSSSAAISPPAATASGGIVVGNPAAPVKLIAYEDPQCPICREFEQINGPTLKTAVTSGKVSVEYRMRSFLGVESVRADNALAAAQSEGKFEPLREALFAHQPHEQTGGFTTDDLLAVGRSVGLTDAAFTDAVRSMTYAKWVAFVDDRASRDGNVGTPQLIRVGAGTLSTAQTFDPVQFKAALGLS
ncbi:MAG: DsbA family protein [Acidothermaceae bacterium]